MADRTVMLVWRDPATAPSDFADALLAFAGSDRGHATGLIQCNIADDHVDAAAALRQRALDPQPEALVVSDRTRPAETTDVFARVRAELLALGSVDAVHGYAVTSREPLTDPTIRTEPGMRSPGWSQVALLRRAPGLDTDTFRARWLDHHTKVAIDTQSTFRYVQHVVAAPLSDGAPRLDGIVEECFPTGAMDDPHVFFASGGDPTRLGERITAMVDSVSAFLDLDDLDVIPTSEYRFWP